MSILADQSRAFERLFDAARGTPASRESAKVLPLKQPVDLRVQLERALIELEDAAALLDVHYPASARMKRNTLQRIRNLIGQS